jgi:hypothetical protein
MRDLWWMALWPTAGTVAVAPERNSAPPEGEALMIELRTYEVCCTLTGVDAVLSGYPLAPPLATTLPGREASQPRREVVRGLGEPLSQAKLRPKPRPIPVFLARVKKYIYVLRDVPQLRLEGGRHG